MQLILRVASGPQAGQNALVRAGQVLQIGSTEYADFAVAGDAGLADVHFAVECGFDRCQIRDLGTESGTLVNGAPITESRIRNGDRISAGQTTFTVEIEGESAELEDASAEAGPTLTSGYAKVACARATEICEHVELNDEAVALLTDALTTRQFVELLAENDRYIDAIRFLAYALPKREAVWWGARSLENAPDTTVAPRDAAARQAAVNWVQEPTEENRRIAEQAAQAISQSTSAGLLAWGAFYSEGSIAPPTAPVTPPDEYLTAINVSCSVLLAAHGEDQEEINRSFAALLDKGCEIADGKDDWE